MHTPHFAKNVFFSCIDDRLVDSHQKFVSEIGGAFCSSMAGGGLALISLDYQNIALEQISVAYTINKINHVYLESHTDCGAYRLKDIVFNSYEEEINKLYRDLNTASMMVYACLLQVGARADEVAVTVRVVDPLGNIVPATQASKQHQAEGLVR